MGSVAAGLDRRNFLIGLGVLGAAAGGNLLLPNSASAAVFGMAGPPTPAVDDLTRDTFNGLAVFLMPGPDPYSIAQGTPRTEPGAIEARTGDYLINLFDNYLGLPDGTVMPLSPLISLLLNSVAAQVRPTTGPFQSPFANLFWPEKAAVFSLLENPPPPLLDAILSQLPAELRPLVQAVLPYLVGGLLAYPSLGGYSEWAVFDRNTRTLTGRPVGWQVSGFDPGVLNGWNEFKGYYQGRRGVSN
jgi:hypothetical protein